jgi:hypothetical protein
MKKRGKNNFHFSNRLSYTLIAIFLLAAIGVGVYALAPGVIPNPGHSYAEISTCGPNQILKMNSAGTDWTCAGGGAGGGTAIFKDSSGKLTTDGGYNCNPTNVYYDCSGGCTQSSLLASCPVTGATYQQYVAACAGFGSHQREWYFHVGNVGVYSCYGESAPTTWPNLYNDGNIAQSLTNGHGTHTVVGTAGGVCATNYNTCPNTLLGYLI